MLYYNYYTILYYTIPYHTILYHNVRYFTITITAAITGRQQRVAAAVDAEEEPRVRGQGQDRDVLGALQHIT